MTSTFWNFIESYNTLSEPAKKAWSEILRHEKLEKGGCLLRAGVVPRDISFVEKGLLSYDYLNGKGEKITKKFFADGSLVASTSALLKKEPGIFSIQALEASVLVSYSFDAFRRLTEVHNDIAVFYTRYLERHWVIEKELNEISLKADTAKDRYLHFLAHNSELIPRLKLHQIASYLAITPTQLSRIRSEISAVSQHM